MTFQKSANAYIKKSSRSVHLLHPTADQAFAGRFWDSAVDSLSFVGSFPHIQYQLPT